MSKIIYYVAQSLDGFIATPDGRVDWLAPFETVDYGYHEFIAQIGGLVMGSRTYEQCLTFGAWPYGALPAVVATTRQLTLPERTVDASQPNVRFRSGTAEQLAKVARTAAAGRDLWLVGGGHLAGQFFAAGLVDELHLFLIPILLGAGVSLAPGALQTQPCKIRDARQWPNGVTGLRYACATADP